MKTTKIKNKAPKAVIFNCALLPEYVREVKRLAKKELRTFTGMVRLMIIEGIERRKEEK